MKSIVIPVVQTWGTEQHLRYAVTDTTRRYWTGSGGTTRQRDALLYSGHHDAAMDARRIRSFSWFSFCWYFGALVAFGLVWRVADVIYGVAFGDERCE
jgi:hypothetical protein